MARTLKITAFLKIRVYDHNGKLLTSFRKPANLIVGNLHKLLALLFFKDYDASRLPADTVYPPFVDSGGTTRPGNRLRDRINHAIIRVQNEQWAAYTFDYSGPTRVMIAIGTGTNPPTIHDYILQSEVAYATSPTRIVGVLSDGRFRVTHAIAIGLTSEITITEAGIWFQFYAYSETSGGYVSPWIMLCRDVFTGITVPAGGTIAVEYSFIV